MALTTEQIETMLSESSGTVIRLKPVPIGSKRLTWAETLERFELGEKIEEDEILPEIPDGVTASSFYRITGISPTIFSEKPFSVFEEDISRPNSSSSDIVSTNVPSSVSPENQQRTTNAQRLAEDSWSDSDIESASDLDPMSFGPINQDGFMGLLGLIPGVGTLMNMARAESPLKVGMAVLGEAFGGKPSGYEAYADLPDTATAGKALENGFITEEQFNAFVTYGPGHYYADGQSATGNRYERDTDRWSAAEDSMYNLDWLGGFGQTDAQQQARDMAGWSYGKNFSEKVEDIQSLRLNAEFSRNFDRFKDQKDMSFIEKLFMTANDGNDDFNDTGVPPSVIGELDEFDADGNNMGPPTDPRDRTFVTPYGYFTFALGHFGNLAMNVGKMAGPTDTRASLAATDAQGKAIRAGTAGPRSPVILDPAKGANLSPTGSKSMTATSQQKTAEDAWAKAFEEEEVGKEERQELFELQAAAANQASMTLDSEKIGKPGPGYDAFGTEDSEPDRIDAENKQAFEEGAELARTLGVADAENINQVNSDMYHDAYDFTGPTEQEAASMDPSMGWLDFGGMEAPSAFATPGVAEALQEQYAQNVLDNDTSYKGQTLAAPAAAPAAPAAPVYSYDDYDGDFGGAGDAVGASDADSDSWGDMGSDDGYLASGGRVGMQKGGEAPQGAEAEMANLGMVNEQAAAPQNGGQQSVKDDVPREADSGDYILPYETVLEVGLKQLNRYAKEAIQLAIKNGVNLKGTDLDPTDDVPIKISNYEYHIPKGLVPYFGGGKKYLDKIRDEGLALRKRLEEEKQPTAQQQQPMQPPAPPQEAPPQEAMPQMAENINPMATADQMPPEQGAAPPMMLAKGGFVLDPEEAIKSAEQALVSDTSQPTQSAYNQVQAIKRASGQGQQPPMVDPNGQVVQQGFAAPQGYQDGSMVENLDIAQGVEPKAEPPMPDWANRALDPKTPVLMDEETGEPQTLQTVTDEINGMFHVYPTIRMIGKELKRYNPDEALSITMKKKDSIKFKTQQEADSWAQNLSSQVGKLRDLQQPKMPSESMALPMATVDEQPESEEGMLPMMSGSDSGFIEQQPMQVE